MFNSDHNPSHKVRRLVASVGVVVSLIMILWVVVYSTHAGIVPGVSHLIPTSGNIGPHSSCNTPPHRSGDSTASIPSPPLTLPSLFHLPQSYPTQPQPLSINYHA